MGVMLHDDESKMKYLEEIVTAGVTFRLRKRYAGQLGELYFEDCGNDDSVSLK